MTELKLGKDVSFIIFYEGTLDLFRLKTLLLLLLLPTFRHSLTVVAIAVPVRNLLNKFWADSVTCLDTISPAVVVSVGLLSTISVRILPPVYNVLRPTALPRSTEVGGPSERGCRKIADPVSSLSIERGGINGTDPRSS